MRRGRRLAFDYGDVRIGVAVSDQDSILATPVVTLKTKGEELWNEIFDLLSEYEPVGIFVGRPIHMAGHESPSTTKADLFAKEIKERFDLEVTMVDERLSTVSAAKTMRETGKSTRDSKKIIDQIAAVTILEMGLSLEKAKEPRSE